MAAAGDFANMVPGFDFFQGLMKSAGAGMPGVNQWIAPTLNPEELEKRIEELRTVQFWLEQNARMLGVTIQALEVQRLTLSTLKSMNLPLADISESLRMKPPEPAPAPAPVPAAPPAPAPAASQAAAPEAVPAAAPAATAGGVDPLQWWGALTQQFAELAASAVKEGSTAAVKGLAGAVLPATAEVASPAPKVAAKVPRKVAAARRRPA
jgi:hypothetical protein